MTKSVTNQADPAAVPALASQIVGLLCRAGDPTTLCEAGEAIGIIRAALHREKWTKEANCYAGGAMMESPMGDMNRASATVIRAMLADFKTLSAAPAPHRGPHPLDLDTAKFLELLLSECMNDDEHSWRKCRRCLAIAQIQDRDKLGIRFVAHAIERLRAAAAPASPPLGSLLERMLNEAHEALDKAGAPKTKHVTNRHGTGSEEITLSVAERIRRVAAPASPHQEHGK